MKKSEKIIMDKKDLKEILTKHFSLKSETVKISINVTKGDRPFDSDDTEIIIEGEKYNVFQK